MQADRTLLQANSESIQSTSWSKAYLRFLRSKNENVILKIAPLALIGIVPIEILSNLVPIVGELNDVGYVVMLTIVVFRTINQVRKYR